MQPRNVAALLIFIAAPSAMAELPPKRMSHPVTVITPTSDHTSLDEAANASGVALMQQGMGLTPKPRLISNSCCRIASLVMCVLLIVFGTH
eukprot:2834689-Pyramimonas_sp.AAC.1